MTGTMELFIKHIPKAELHLHLEGTLEPELLFLIAERNKILLPYASMDELKKAYSFQRLQDFLDIYYQSTNVLIAEQDFYDLTWAYALKMKEQHVVHVEVSFDPQAHTSRGIPFQTVVGGIHQALVDADRLLGISSRLIMSFLRHLDASSAMKTLQESLPFRSWITGVGLDSSELGNPPSKFRKVFEKASEAGYVTVAHAGEEGPSSYVREAIYHLRVSRIDHGNRSLDDNDLMQELADRQIPLTLCPLSNLKLKVVDDLSQSPLKKMMDQGLLVTVNSDDPAYFSGYLNENLIAITQALNLTKYDLYRLARNSFAASFLPEEVKRSRIGEVEDYYRQHKE